jgi:hypothetical protein
VLSRFRFVNQQIRVFAIRQTFTDAAALDQAIHDAVIDLNRDREYIPNRASRLANSSRWIDPKLRPAAAISARFDKEERLIAYATFFNATLPFFLLRSARTNLSHFAIPARFSGM